MATAGDVVIEVARPCHVVPRHPRRHVLDEGRVVAQTAAADVEGPLGDDDGHALGGGERRHPVEPPRRAEVAAPGPGRRPRAARARVVEVDPDVVDVGAARIGLGRAVGVGIGAGAVGVPHEAEGRAGHGAHRGDDGAPVGGEVGGATGVGHPPGVPVAVELPAEAQHRIGLTAGHEGPGEGREVRVVVPGGARRQRGHRPAGVGGDDRHPEHQRAPAAPPPVEQPGEGPRPRHGVPPPVAGKVVRRQGQMGPRLGGEARHAGRIARPGVHAEGLSTAGCGARRGGGARAVGGGGSRGGAGHECADEGRRRGGLPRALLERARPGPRVGASCTGVLCVDDRAMVSTGLLVHPARRPP